MAISRAFYISFYTGYLVSLSASIALLLTYSGAPLWVWSFYGVAILLFIVGLFIKEVFLKEEVSIETGHPMNKTSINGWSIVYGIGSLIAAMLLFIGIGFSVFYSTIPVWVWIVFTISITLFIASTTVLGIWPDQTLTSTILNIIGMILFVVAVLGIAVSSNAPWWVWLSLFITVSLGLISHWTEIESRPNKQFVRVVEQYPSPYPTFQAERVPNLDHYLSHSPYPINVDNAGQVLGMNQWPVKPFLVDNAGNIK